MSSLHETFISRRMAIEIDMDVAGATVRRTLIPRREGGWLLIYRQLDGEEGVCPACGSFNCIEKNCTPQILDDDQVANRWSWSIGLTRAVLLEEGSIHV